MTLAGKRRQAVLISADGMGRCMSGDEAENNEAERAGIYTIIEAAWQSDGLKTFLRSLEATYVKNWKTTVGGRGRGGKAPRRRIAKRDGKVVDSVAPIGLWHNCTP